MEIKTRKFKDIDLINCRSLTNGKLVFEGKRSGNVYRWPGYDHIEPVEYRDLMYALRESKDRSILFIPRVMVLDDDFVSANPALNEFYQQFLNFEDVKEILELPASQMKSVVTSLPLGIQECLKSLVSTAIKNGVLDSVKKIKILDEVFDTQMLMMLASE